MSEEKSDWTKYWAGQLQSGTSIFTGPVQRKPFNPSATSNSGTNIGAAFMPCATSTRQKLYVQLQLSQDAAAIAMRAAEQFGRWLSTNRRKRLFSSAWP